MGSTEKVMKEEGGWGSTEKAMKEEGGWGVLRRL